MLPPSRFGTTLRMPLLRPPYIRNRAEGIPQFLLESRT